MKARAPGKWSGYVEQDLLPRLHGFELLMASYAMCHMKLDMQLTESGYKPSPNPPRLSVWLTNALEPAEREVRDLFFAPLAEEARGASEVKRQSPIMCVIGNPPYSGESQNTGDHIMALMDAYKKEPGGKERLKERNSKWINDDYVKFIRMAEDLIAKSPSGGVLAFITNHGYLDNPTFRGMRWHLLKTFDKIWLLDLHGNLKSRETSPDGSPDTNVFDIQPGVAIIVAARSGRANTPSARLQRGDLWGSRQAKSEALGASTLSSGLEQIEPAEPFLIFGRTDADLRSRYDPGFQLDHLFGYGGVGICTKRDTLAYHDAASGLEDVLTYFRDHDEASVKRHFAVTSESRDQRVSFAQDDIRSNGVLARFFATVLYRPFDKKITYLTGKVRGFLAYPVNDLSKNFGNGRPNFALVTGRQGQAVGGEEWNLASISDATVDLNIFRRGGGITFPLYQYPSQQTGQADAFAPTHRTLNLEPILYTTICAAAGIDPVDQAGPDDDFRAATGNARPSEVKVFDYIYGVLHAPAYRATFAELLKIDFPRIPYPPSSQVFAQVSGKGEQLRRLHLMEPAAIGDTPYPYHGDGDDVVASGYPKFQNNRVLINPDQYFDAVPPVAWSFHIGGYQPAQKWLKDRRGRSLSYDDIGHYQRIVKILAETDRLMREIELEFGY